MVISKGNETSYIKKERGNLRNSCVQMILNVPKHTYRWTSGSLFRGSHPTRRQACSLHRDYSQVHGTCCGHRQTLSSAHRWPTNKNNMKKKKNKWEQEKKKKLFTAYPSATRRGSVDKIFFICCLVWWCFVLFSCFCLCFLFLLFFVISRFFDLPILCNFF